MLKACVLGEPRLAINMWKKKALKTEEERPKSAPATGSKFFRTVPKPFKLSTGNITCNG